ncbi:MAG: exonuclease subunit SbcD [Bacteroidia bacterium]|nr:exonuclease subunit SbcD [Bacteroidia bacterium]
MKILHTADWHLGKKLDHFSRLEEQRAVLDEICEIADREQVDAVIVAGDLFDQINPSVEAIDLLYKSLKKLAKNGHRPVVGIAGNHDSPDRIEAPVPLARECGIVLTGYPNSHPTPFSLDSGLSITQADEGFVELKIPGINFPLRLILTPYANEIRLKKFLGTENPETELRTVLQQTWRNLADKYCDPLGVNILMAHLFLINKSGEKPEEPEDEKPILTVGGAQEIFTENLPPQVQYVALGHLHRPQVIEHTACPVVYSGSPLAYSMSEAGQEKFVFILEAEPQKPISWVKIPLISGKKLHRKTFDSIQETIHWLQENPNTLVELTFVSDQFMTAEERKLIMEAHEGIITLIPRINNPDSLQFQTLDIDLSRDISELFTDYFRYKQGQEPNDRIMNLLKEVLAEDEE